MVNWADFAFRIVMFSLQNRADYPRLPFRLYISNPFSVSYTFSFFWRKDPGRFITYLTFPAMNNNDFVVFTNCPLRVVCF